MTRTSDWCHGGIINGTSNQDRLPTGSTRSDDTNCQICSRLSTEIAAHAADLHLVPSPWTYTNSLVARFLDRRPCRARKEMNKFLTWIWMDVPYVRIR